MNVNDDMLHDPDLFEIEDNLDYISNVVSGLESYLTGKMTDGAKTGRGLVEGIFFANDIPFRTYAGQESWLETLKSGLNKTLEAIKKAFNAIKDFFTKNKGDVTAATEKAIDELTAGLNELLKANADAEVPDGYFDSFKKQLADGKVEAASKLDGVKSVKEAIVAMQAISKELADRKSAINEAQKELNDVNTAMNDFSGSANGLKEDAPAEEKDLAKSQISEKSEVLKKKLADAKARVAEAFKTPKLLNQATTLVNNLKAKLTKPKEVAGQEAWNY